MSKLWRLLGSFLMLVGWLVPTAGTVEAKAVPVDKKEPVKQEINPSTPIYLQYGAGDYIPTLSGKDASQGKMTIVHWNHWSHHDHFSHSNHGSHGSHWNSW